MAAKKNRKKTTPQDEISTESLRATAPPIPPELLEAEARRTERRSKYNALLQQIAGMPAIERATAWLGFVAEESEQFLDQESLVYVRCQGQEKKKEIAELRDWMRRASERAISQARPPVKLGENPDDAIVRGDAPWFWSPPLGLEGMVPAALMRAVEWCDIGGFEPWWENLNRQLLSDAIDPIRAGQEMFYFARSEYALERIGAALAHGLRVALFNREAWKAERKVYLSCVAGLLFTASRIPSAARSGFVDEASRLLLLHQNSNGSWNDYVHDRDPSSDTTHVDERDASVDTTAMAVHALCLARPHGYQLAVDAASNWLLSQQAPEGCWQEPGVPSTYLTVLVLDAIELARGGAKVTCLRAARQKLALPGQSDAAEQPGILSSPETSHTYIKEGGAWRIRCGSERGTYMSARLGFGYIHQLLLASPAPVEATDLEGRTVTTPALGDPVIGNEGLSEMRERVRDLQEEIEELTAQHDLGRAEQKRDELGHIAEFLKQNTRPDGRSRSAEKDRPGDRVGKAIKAALAKMEEDMPVLRKHFEESIVRRSSNSPAYVPRVSVPWVLR